MSSAQCRPIRPGLNVIMRRCIELWLIMGSYMHDGVTAPCMYDSIHVGALRGFSNTTAGVAPKERHSNSLQSCDRHRSGVYIGSCQRDILVEIQDPRRGILIVYGEFYVILVSLLAHCTQKCRWNFHHWLLRKFSKWKNVSGCNRICPCWRHQMETFSALLALC